jgi:hypothetical protein
MTLSVQASNPHAQYDNRFRQFFPTPTPEQQCSDNDIILRRQNDQPHPSDSSSQERLDPHRIVTRSPVGLFFDTDSARRPPS